MASRQCPSHLGLDLLTALGQGLGLELAASAVCASFAPSLSAQQTPKVLQMAWSHKWYISSAMADGWPARIIQLIIYESMSSQQQPAVTGITPTVHSLKALHILHVRFVFSRMPKLCPEHFILNLN